MALLSWSAPALGQTALYHEELPDLELLHTAIDTKRGEVRALAEAAAGQGYRFAEADHGLSGLGLGLLLGYSPEQARLIKLRSQLGMTVPWVERGGEPRLMPELSGRHQLYGRLALGGFADPKERHHGGPGVFADKRLGVDLVMSGRLDHGRAGERFSRHDLGAGAFRALDVSAGLWLRRATSGQSALVLPIRAHYGTVGLQDASGAGQQLATHRYGVAAGFGIKDYMRYVYHGWLELIGLGWERFEPPSGPPAVDTAPATGAVDRFTLKVFNIDDIVFRDVGVFGFGKETLFGTSAFIGAEWLRGSAGEEPPSEAIFAFGGQATVRFSFLGGDDETDVELALGGSHHAEPTPHRRDFAELWRLESHAALNVPAYQVGGQLGFVATWQDDLADVHDAASSIGLSSEFWIGLTGELQIAATHRSRTGAPLSADGWQRDDRWQHDAALWLRWRGGEGGKSRYRKGSAGYSPLLPAISSH